MGILQTADTMVDNTIKQLSDVLNSKFTTYLQGAGTPVLVTYYNIDVNNSTVNIGSENYDQMLGPQSPLRFNKILDFPVYGLKEFIPSKDQLDGGLVDMELDMEVVILPNSIKPNPMDYLDYRFMDGSNVTYRVTDVEYSSIKSNAFYKLTLTIQSINDSITVDPLEKQVIKTYNTCLDVIGTNEQCIITDTVYKTISQIQQVYDYLVGQYLDVFYDNKYNCLLSRVNSIGYPLFDPYLTKFICQHNLLDRDNRYIVLVEYDMRYEVKKCYNISMFKCLELKDNTHVERISMRPQAFQTTDTTPFAYYGEESVFSMDLVEPTEPYKYPNRDEFHIEMVSNLIDESPYKYDYLNRDFINRVQMGQPYDDIDVPRNNSLQFSNIIINYLTKGNLYGLITDKDVHNLLLYEVQPSHDDFVYVPMLLYAMQQYLSFLRNNK